MSTRYRAYDQFDKTVGRAHDLIRLYLDLIKTQREAAPVASDVVRGAIVLAVAGMDAYFTNQFVELLVPFIKKHGPNDRLVSLLERAGLNAEQALIMATMDRPFRRIRTLVDAYLSAYTTQRFHAIDELFLCFGIKDLSQHAAAKTGRKTCMRRVEMLILRRHQIVHDGDLNKRGRLQQVDPIRSLNQIGSLILFVGAAARIIGAATKV